MKIFKIIIKISFCAALLTSSSCNIPKMSIVDEHPNIPMSYKNEKDTNNIAIVNWRNYFTDTNLIALIDTAIKNNQELKIILKELEVSNNEISARRGEYLPFVNLNFGSGPDRSGKYTWNGQSEEDWKNNNQKPKYLGDYLISANATWEIDVWKKLRNAKKSAVMRFLADVEGKNFMITNLIAEIADSYYELLTLDNLLNLIETNIAIQDNALKAAQIQKDAAKVTQLAVNRFEAQLFNTKNLKYEVLQRITETENRINFLTGRYPKHINRQSDNFMSMDVSITQSGIPAQLLNNRPDIKRSEYLLKASKLDVSSARASFFPNIALRAGLGFQSFNPVYLINPQSIIYNLAGDLVAPLVNRYAIRANFNSASAKQLQALYNYDQTILNAYIEVINQLSKNENFTQSFKMKSQEVETLVESVSIANNLFNSARADYAEVLLTQRDALESKMQLIEIKQKLLESKVNLYRALGGGWN